MRSTTVVLLLFFASLTGHARQALQTSQSAPTFEVASVKRSAPDAFGSLISGPAPSGFTTSNAPLDRIIQYAYAIADYQLVDAPAWTRSERFDIVTRYPEGDTRSRVPEMVQALLAERFALRVHKEVREGPAFELVTVRSDGRLGAKLRRTEVDCVAFTAKAAGTPQFIGPDGRPICMSIASDRFIRGSSRTIEVLSLSLARQVGRRVVNRTGLTGDFDFDLEWSPEIRSAGAPANAGAPQAPLDDNLSIFTALREQLGLELKSTTEPIDVIVIDSVSAPTPD